MTIETGSSIRMNKLVRDSFFSMGTDVHIDIVSRRFGSETEIRDAFRKVRIDFAQMENTFSRFLPQSELMRLNGNLHVEQVVSEAMAEVLELSLEYWRETDGLFEPRVFADMLASGYGGSFWSPRQATSGSTPDPQRYEAPLDRDIVLDTRKRTVVLKRPVDLSGIVKGYAVERTSIFLREAGFTDFVVDAGGDMYASGKNPDREDWRISIEGIPEERLMLNMTDRSVATSGRTRRFWEKDGKMYHHIVDPANPSVFSFALKTVTVVTPGPVRSDAWAKALFLKSVRGGLELADEKGISAVFLDDSDSYHLSRDIYDYVYKE